MPQVVKECGKLIVIHSYILQDKNIRNMWCCQLIYAYMRFLIKLSNTAVPMMSTRTYCRTRISEICRVSPAYLCIKCCCATRGSSQVWLVNCDPLVHYCKKCRQKLFGCSTKGCPLSGAMLVVTSIVTTI